MARSGTSSGSRAIDHCLGNRTHSPAPLIQKRWLGTADIIRFTLGAFLLRLLTAEQAFVAIGLQQTLGMAADPLQPLYGILLIGTNFRALTERSQTLAPLI